MRTPRSTQEQCQAQLKLERLRIVGLMHSSDDGGVQLYDPVERELARQLQTRLRNVEHALRRIEENQFGMCQMCRQPIDTDRLLALPSAELCIDCQRANERSGAGRARRNDYRTVPNA